MNSDEQEKLNKELWDTLETSEDIEDIKQLIKDGADVNAVDEDGHTAVFYARTLEQLALLADAGAGFNEKDRDNVRKLIFDSKEFDDIHKLDFASTIEEIKMLKEAGVDINARDTYGCTALFYAETAEKTKLLIDAGADVNAEDEHGHTALYFAGTAEQKKLLIDAGAKDKDDRTAEITEQKKLLKEIGAKDKDDRTVLMLADTAEQGKFFVEVASEEMMEDLARGIARVLTPEQRKQLKEIKTAEKSRESRIVEKQMQVKEWKQHRNDELLKDLKAKIDGTKEDVKASDKSEKEVSKSADVKLQKGNDGR